MEKYSKAVSEMYSQFKKEGAHPMEKYIGKHVVYWGKAREIVGYSTGSDGSCCLIIDASKIVCRSILSRSILRPTDIVFKECKSYWHVSVSNLID